MSSKDLVLNIAVNMDRISRFLQEGREKRVQQFIHDTQIYLDQLEEENVDQKFHTTLKKFKNEFEDIKKNAKYNEIWAEKALNWANILQHRAKLA